MPGADSEQLPLDRLLGSVPGQVIRIHAYDRTAQGWYTNPHGNELPGHRFASLRSAKEQLGEDYHLPVIVVSLRGSDGAERVPGDKWEEKDIGRTVAGCLTDLAVMARMGLVHAKIVLNPSEGDSPPAPPSSRGTSGTDVRAELKDIIQYVTVHSTSLWSRLIFYRRLRPPGRNERDDAKAAEDDTTEYGQVVALLLTVNHFLPIALKGHGLVSADG